MRPWLLLALLPLVSSCEQTQLEYESVVVLGDAFEAVSEVTDSKALQRFGQLWEAKETVAAADIAFGFKLDIRARGRSVRWLYNSDGFARVLTAKSTPVYKVADAESLNSILGIKR